MGNAVIAGENREEFKSKNDPLRIMDVATNRDKRFVSASPEKGGTEVLARKRYMSRRIFRILEVIVEGLFSAKCDSCHYWRRCPALREPKPEWPGDADANRKKNNPPCPVFDWLRKIA